MYDDEICSTKYMRKMEYIGHSDLASRLHDCINSSFVGSRGNKRYDRIYDVICHQMRFVAVRAYTEREIKRRIPYE